MLQSPTRFVQGRSIALGLIVIPVLLFYAALLHQLTNIPFADDYAVLNFIHNLNLQPGALAKASYILSVQFNEYKVPLEAVVFTAQYSFLGHINFIGLCMLGNAAILLLGVVLWKMFLPSLHHEPRRVALFIPVSWLLFQLSYGETLNWAAPGIQNLYVIGFSFAAFLLLDRAGRWAFTGALAFLVLAIAASGNGLIAAFTGFIALAVSRRFRRLAAWTAVTLMMMLVYAYHYNPSSSQSSRHDSVFQALLHVKVFYGISFLGGAAGVVEVPHLPRLVRSIALGFALCAFFGYLALRRKLSANRAVNCAVAFLFLTGLGVAGIRSGMGMLSSLNSRYRIYSDLLLIFVWFFVCERRLQFSARPLRQSRVFLAGCILAVLFSLEMDAAGYRLLARRHDELITGMRTYEHPDPADPLRGPIFVSGDYYFKVPLNINLAARDELAHAAAAGVYTPPAY